MRQGSNELRQDGSVVSDEVLERRGEVAALWLLLIGGIVLPVVGWIIGVVLLWASELWTRRDKLIGTFVVPGGLLLPLAVNFLGAEWGACPGEASRTLPDGTRQLVRPELCEYTGGIDQPWLAVIVIGLAVASIGSILYLARRRLGPAMAAADGPGNLDA